MTDQPAPAPARSVRRPAIPVPNFKFIYILFLLGLGAGYLLLVWQMERIEISLELLQQSPTDIGLFLADLFVRIVRHFIPVFLGWMMAATSAATLLLLLYDLPDLGSARALLRRLWSSNGMASGGVITVTPKTIEAMRNDSTCLRVGGPCRVLIPTGNIATTEINGRFKRVLPSGSHSLEGFEYIHNVLDLHPQERSNNDVRLSSRESLEVTTNVSVIFRIHTGKAYITPDEPFPYNEAAVKKLAYDQTNFPNKIIGTWESHALRTVISVLSRIVSTFPIDVLLQDPQSGLSPHLSIRQNTFREARAKLGELGIELIRFRLGRFRFPEDVVSQHMQNWRIEQELETRSRFDLSEPSTQADVEITKAEAELNVLHSLAEEIVQSPSIIGDTSTAAQRFLVGLEKLAGQMDAEDEEQLKERLERLHHQLMHGEEWDG